MSERIDHRLGGRSFPDADRLREQLQMSLDVLNGLQDNRDQSDRYGNAYDSFVDDSQWEESPERERAIDDAPRGPQIPRPSDWGASPAVDLPIDSDYFEKPLAKERVRLPSRRAVAHLLMAAGVTGTGLGWSYDAEIDNPYSFVASLPVIGRDDPAKKELLDTLLADCADENIGDVLYRGNVSAESSMIWNVPNADGTISPLLPTRLDPGSDVERHPKAIVENSILSVGVCDTDNHPALNIKGEKVTIDLSRVDSRIMLEREKVHAEGIQKERLDASVKAGAFPQATADALYAEMTSPANIDMAIGNTLHNAGKSIVAPGGTYDKQVEEVSKTQLVVKITEQLAAKTPGISYQVETINEFDDSALIGLSEVSTDKLTIVDTHVTKATIAIDPKAVTS